MSDETREMLVTMGELEDRIEKLEAALEKIRDHAGQYLDHDVGSVRSLATDVVVAAHAALDFPKSEPK